MSKHHNRREWHQQKRWVIGSLLLFPPLGIPLLWRSRWPRAGKIGGSIFSGVLLLSVLTGEANRPATVTALSPTIESPEAPAQAKPAPSPAYEEAIAQATAATAELTAAESSGDWSSVADGWQRAIASLGDVPTSSNDYSQAQVKLAEYERNYDYAITQKTAIEAAAAAAIAQRQAEEQLAAPPVEEPEPALSTVETQADYMSGTCKDLRARGVGSNFTPGDANYTPTRDRDNDGVACES